MEFREEKGQLGSHLAERAAKWGAALTADFHHTVSIETLSREDEPGQIRVFALRHEGRKVYAALEVRAGAASSILSVSPGDLASLRGAIDEILGRIAEHEPSLRVFDPVEAHRVDI